MHNSESEILVLLPCSARCRDSAKEKFVKAARRCSSLECSRSSPCFPNGWTQKEKGSEFSFKLPSPPLDAAYGVAARRYRCAHLLAKSRVQPASSAAVRACAPSWPVDRVGVLEGAQAVRWHPQAAVVPWLWASQLDRESGLGNGLEGDSEGSLGVVDIF